MNKSAVRSALRFVLIAAAASLCAACYATMEVDDLRSDGDGDTDDAAGRDLDTASDRDTESEETDVVEPDTESEMDVNTDSVEPDTESDVDTDSGPPTEGSTWCWLVAPRSDGKLAVLQVDMDSGYQFEMGAFGDGINEAFHTAGLARLGDTLVMAGYTEDEFSWVEIDLSLDTVTISGNAGEDVAVGTDGTRLVTLCGGPVGGGFCFFDDFDALCAGTPSEVMPSTAYASRLCATPDSVYTAWHSTDEVDVFDRATGATITTIGLEDWDGWVWGMSVAGGMLHLSDMMSGITGTRVAQFWPESGAIVSDVAVDWDMDLYTHPPSGLWCEGY